MRKDSTGQDQLHYNHYSADHLRVKGYVDRIERKGSMMANLTLGLDLGSGSIGWALIDQEGQRVIGLGVRVFPEGVARDQKGGEKSKNQDRREARGIRRQVARRARRRRLLREALTQVGLLPADREEFARVIAQDPYVLRRKALREKLELHELGRALFHLAQRRGYLSNRKTDKAKAADQKGLLAKIAGLATTLEEEGATLGEYLANLRERAEYGKTSECARLRNRPTRRDMYEAEFKAIWEKQRAHYPQLLTDTLKYGRCGKQGFPREPERLPAGRDLLGEYGVFGLVFFQRKTYSPKSVIGRCELERGEKRCPRAARIAQRFRIVQEVNNLRILDYANREERRLTQGEREAIIGYLSEAKERTFVQLRKKLQLHDQVRFNLERGGREKLQGHQTDAILAGKNGIGKRWKDLDGEVRDAIVDILLNEERDEVVVRRLTEECGLGREEAERASAVHLPDGYVNFSRLAMTKLLPHLERGLALMADDASNSALHAAGYLRPDQREVSQRCFLPAPPNLTNPIVRQAVIEVRKVVNALLRDYVYRNGHRLERIHVELAREAKKSFEERKQLRFDNAARRKLREDAARKIEEFDASVKPSRATVNRYLLWQEQGEFCVYCGQKISMAQLFNGETDVDHILPRWRSLDDSLANKVICHRTCNQDKQDRTPREWLESADLERYERMLQIVTRLPYGKQRKFQQKDIRLDDFVARQLTDTAYISRSVSQYLRCLGARVLCPRGEMTSDLRHWWGLNNILDVTKSDKKNRNDYRHHAVDALTLALTDDKRLHALANARGRGMPLPWQGFRDDAERAVLAIHVSHRAQRGLRGALHKDTIYGVTQKRSHPATETAAMERPWAKDWVENERVFVRRKLVTELTDTGHLAKVRDKTIRQILEQHLRDRGVDPAKRGKLPGKIFEGENTPRMPSGVPIKRVRMMEKSQTIRQVSKRRSFQYVDPGSNHHILYRSCRPGDSEVWKAEVVPMFDAAKRALAGQPLVDTSDSEEKGRFVMSLSIGDAFQIDDADGRSLLCVVRKLDQRSGRLYYRLHTDAREAKQLDQDNLYLSPSQMQRRNARKVTLDPLGRLRWADTWHWKNRGLPAS